MSVGLQSSLTASSSTPGIVRGNCSGENGSYTDLLHVYRIIHLCSGFHTREGGRSWDLPPQDFENYDVIIALKQGIMAVGRYTQSIYYHFNMLWF